MPLSIGNECKLLIFNYKFWYMEELFTSTSNVSLDVFLTKMIDLGVSVGSKILLAIVCSSWGVGLFGD